MSLVLTDAQWTLIRTKIDSIIANFTVLGDILKRLESLEKELAALKAAAKQ